MLVQSGPLTKKYIGRKDHFATSCSKACLTCLKNVYTSLVSLSSSSIIGKLGRKGFVVGTVILRQTRSNKEE